MKLAVQALVLGIFAVGASGAILSSHANLTSNRSVANASVPMPPCGPSGCSKSVEAVPMPPCGPSGCSK